MSVIIQNICPAPAGLVVVFNRDQNGQAFEHREPVAALGMITDAECHTSTRYAVTLVIDTDIGTLSPADEDSDFDRLEWLPQAKACQCSANYDKP